MTLAKLKEARSLSLCSFWYFLLFTVPSINYKKTNKTEFQSEVPPVMPVVRPLFGVYLRILFDLG